jgi:hypothetical protein
MKGIISSVSTEVRLNRVQTCFKINLQIGEFCFLINEEVNMEIEQSQFRIRTCIFHGGPEFFAMSVKE